MNRVLVSTRRALLDPQPGERIADLFCGLGNFSLPLAARGAQVIGFEGSASWSSARAAERGGQRPRGPVRGASTCSSRASGRSVAFGQILIDPPREGAVELVKSLPEGEYAAWPQRLLYVSCDPATLARDAGMLVHTKGFRLAAAGVVNMFPHTAHVESIALFER